LWGINAHLHRGIQSGIGKSVRGLDHVNIPNQSQLLDGRLEASLSLSEGASFFWLKLEVLFDPSSISPDPSSLRLVATLEECWSIAAGSVACPPQLDLAGRLSLEDKGWIRLTIVALSAGFVDGSSVVRGAQEADDEPPL
jgi:hypothetical protein